MAFFVSGSSSGSFGQITVDGDIVPKQAETYDLGTATKPFRDLHVSSGSIKMYAGSEEIARIQVSDDDEFEFFSTRGLSAAQKRTFTKSQIRSNATPGKFRGGNIGISATSTGSFAKVGIGTSSPTRQLQINASSYTEAGGADANIHFSIANSTWSGIGLFGGSSQGGFIDFGDTDATHRGRILYSHASDYMAFNTAATERVRITSGGNVGIGDTTPSYPLDVAGIIASTAAVGVFRLVGTTNGRIYDLKSNAGRFEIRDNYNGQDRLIIGTN